MHVVGPMLASGSDAHGAEKKQAHKTQEIDKFMNSVLKTHGPKSLVYVSLDFKHIPSIRSQN